MAQGQVCGHSGGIPGPREARLVVRPPKLRRKSNVKQFIKRLWQEEEGQDLVEYGLLIVLIGLAGITAMKGLASALTSVFSSAASSLTATS